MIIDLKNTKVRNAFAVLGVLGFLLIYLPLSFQSTRFQNCIERVGLENRELCELSRHADKGDMVGPVFVKLASVASVILGCLFILASVGYLLTKYLKKEVSKMRNDVTANEPVKTEVRGGSVKSLLEMKQLLDERLITPEEFEAYKKSYLGKLQ